MTPNKPGRGSVLSTGFVLIIITALLVGQQTLIVPGESHLSAAIHNAMHVPWSAVLTLLLRRFTRSWWRAIPIAMLIFVGSEALQLVTGRTASFTDVVSDILGMLLALAVFTYFRTRIRSIAVACAAAATLIVGYAAWPIGMVMASHLWLMQNAPVLFDASLKRGHFLADFTGIVESAETRPPGLRITLAPRRWSGMHLREMPGRLANQHHLVLDLIVEGRTPLRLATSVRYAGFDKPVSRSFLLEPGPQLLRIPLGSLAMREPGNTIPFESSTELYIYGSGNQAGRSFILHRVYLQ